MERSPEGTFYINPLPAMRVFANGLGEISVEIGDDSVSLPAQYAKPLSEALAALAKEIEEDSEE